MTIAITDVVLRDAHQSLFATRLRLDDMLPIAAQLDDVGYGSLECWGGATFDACIRFLGEDPWLRLRELKKAMPKTPLQMLLLVSLLLLWLAIAKKFEPLLLLPIGFGGLLSNIPEAGLALTALESLLAHHDAGQLAVIAAKLNCAPDVHAIKEALALALPSVQSQMENLAVDMGYTPGVLALFYKVAIGSGVAPLVIFMGVGAMTDFGPLLANPR
ncbi:hypothetical protein DW464_17045, partial [Salmonella enterica]|nr:hypothetical protein [Salmonella enterica]